MGYVTLNDIRPITREPEEEGEECEEDVAEGWDGIVLDKP